MEGHNYILKNRCWQDIKKKYLHFILTKLDSKGRQIKDFDVIFQMHIEAKIFDIIKYLKNEKNQKLKKKKKKKIGKIV